MQKYTTDASKHSKSRDDDRSRDRDYDRHSSRHSSSGSSSSSSRHRHDDDNRDRDRDRHSSRHSTSASGSGSSSSRHRHDDDYDRDRDRNRHSRHSTSASGSGSSSSHRRVRSRSPLPERAPERQASTDDHKARSAAANSNPVEAAKLAREYNLKGKKCDEALTFVLMRKKHKVVELTQRLLERDLNDPELKAACAAEDLSRIGELLTKHKNNQYSEAKRVIDQLPPKDQNRSDISLERARINFGFGNYDEAIKSCLAVCDFCEKTVPSNRFYQLSLLNIVQSQTLIADCYRKQKQHEKALAIYQKLLADNRFKNDTTTCQKLNAQIGYCEEEAGNLDAARDARALNASNTKDKVASAKELRLQKDYAAALKILLPLHQNSNRIDVLLEVLHCYCDQRQYPQALTHLDTFRKQHTVNVFDMFKLKMFEVRLYEDRGDFKQMLERCNEAEALCNTPETLALKAEVLEKRIRCLTEMADKPEFSAQLTGALAQISTTGFAQKTLLPFLQRFTAAKQAEDKGDKTSTVLLEQLAKECKQELLTQTTVVAKNSTATVVVPIMSFDHDGFMNAVVYCFYKSYLALAINYEKIGKLADAQLLYQELLTTPTVSSIPRVVITILIARARCFEKARDANNAHMCLNKAFAVLSQQNANNNSSIQELFDIQLAQARLHQRFGEYTQALFIFDQLLENPEIVKNKEMYRLILLGKARVFEDKKQYAFALAEFEKLIRLYNDVPITTSQFKSSSNDSKHMYDGNEFERFVAMSRNVPFHIMHSWAVCHAEMGQFENTITIMQQAKHQYKPVMSGAAASASSSNPNPANVDNFLQASLLLTNTYLKMGQFKLAKAEIDRYFPLQGNDSPFLQHKLFFNFMIALASCFHQTGASLQAVGLYTKMLEKYAANPVLVHQIHIQQYSLYRDLGEYEKAEAILNQLASQQNDVATKIIILENQISLYKQMQNFTEVILHWNRLIELLNGAGRIHDAFHAQLKLASYYSKCGNHLEAQRLFTSINANPFLKTQDSYQRKFLLAVAKDHLRNNEFSAAKKCYAILIQKFPKEPQFKVIFAIICGRLGDKNAQRELGTLNEPRYIFILADYYLRQGQLELALTQYKRIMVQRPFESHVRISLINVYLRINDPKLLQLAVEETAAFLQQPQFEFNIGLHLVHIEALLANNKHEIAKQRADEFLKKFPHHKYFRVKLMELFSQADMDFSAEIAEEKAQKVLDKALPPATSTAASTAETAAGLVPPGMTPLVSSLNLTKVAAVYNPNEHKITTTLGKVADPFSKDNLQMLLCKSTFERHHIFTHFSQHGQMYKLYHCLKFHGVFDKLFPSLNGPPLAEDNLDHRWLSVTMRRADRNAQRNQPSLHFFYLAIIVKEIHKYLPQPLHIFQSLVDHIAACYGIDVNNYSNIYHTVMLLLQAREAFIKSSLTIPVSVGASATHLPALPMAQMVSVPVFTIAVDGCPQTQLFALRQNFEYIEKALDARQLDSAQSYFAAAQLILKNLNPQQLGAELFNNLNRKLQHLGMGLQNTQSAPNQPSTSTAVAQPMMTGSVTKGHGVFDASRTHAIPPAALPMSVDNQKPATTAAAATAGNRQ